MKLRSLTQGVGSATIVLLLENVLFAILLGIHAILVTDEPLVVAFLGGASMEFWRIVTFQPAVAWVLLIMAFTISERVGIVRIVIANSLAIFIVSLVDGDLRLFNIFIQGFPSSEINVSFALVLLGSATLTAFVIGLIRKTKMKDMVF